MRTRTAFDLCTHWQKAARVRAAVQSHFFEAVNAAWYSGFL